MTLWRAAQPVTIGATLHTSSLDQQVLDNLNSCLVSAAGSDGGPDAALAAAAEGHISDSVPTRFFSCPGAADFKVRGPNYLADKRKARPLGARWFGILRVDPLGVCSRLFVLGDLADRRKARPLLPKFLELFGLKFLSGLQGYCE